MSSADVSAPSWSDAAVSNVVSGGAPEAAGATTTNSLGFAKAPADTRVVVAMSGGVDSSVVAALLKDEGYDVIGITLQLYDHGAAVQKKGACCAGQDIHDARQVAAAIDIPHYVLDYEEKFRHAVIETFADTYLAGQTPIPCVRCNETVKFRDLLEMAKNLGADCLATGHYIQRVAGAHGAEMHRAVDPDRDQSYFLFSTTPDQLDYLRFPLGGLPKSETRAIAERLGLVVADKPDSQDICFVPSGKYTNVIDRIRPHAHTSGDIVHVDGTVLGRHDGIVHYTVGQRRGLGLAEKGVGGGEPLYVIALEAEDNRVVVGPKEALSTRRIFLSDVNWLGDGPFFEAAQAGLAVAVKVRSMRPPVPAVLRPLGALDAGGGAVDLIEAEEGVAPGQACVFYAVDDNGDVESDVESGAGSRVLGGGWITATERVPG